MNSRIKLVHALRWLLIAAISAPFVLPVSVSAEESTTVSETTPAVDSSSEDVSPSVDATPLVGIEVQTGGWRGLKGRISDVRLVPFAAGVAKGKNLIVIQVEALQDSLVNKRVYGKEITPNLNNLIDASGTWYFPNTFSQIARGNTSDVEWVMNSSLYPPINAAATVKWGDKKVPSLPRQMRSEGYYTATFHANAANFWNRVHLYQALGFNRYYDRSFFGSSHFWKWGTTDRVVYEKTLGVMKGWKANHRKFYAQIVSMSSHRPFTIPESRPWNPTGVYRGTITGDYLSSVSYADRQIGYLISQLKSSGLWDTSVVAIYGDHFGQAKATDSRERAAQKAFYGRDMRSADRLTVPFIVHIPGETSKGTITDTVGQIDILPTLADPLGIDISDMRYYGRNAFTDSRPLVGMRGIMPNGSYADNRILATPGSFAGMGAHLLASWRRVSPSPLDRRVRSDLNRMMASSLRYTNNLPKRPGATRRASNAIIPNE